MTNAERVRQWRVNNREKYLEMKRAEYRRKKESHKAYSQKKVEENRLMAREKLGGECVKCGSKDNLDIDHIYPQDKTCHISRKMGSTNILNEELKVCQLLCQTCHRKKTGRERQVAHKLLMSLSHQQFDKLMRDVDVNITIDVD